MLRAGARLAARGASMLPRLAPVAVAAQHVGLKTLAAAAAPSAIRASPKPQMSAPAETASVPVPAGKISQVIGAVVDVQFGKLLLLWGVKSRAGRPVAVGSNLNFQHRGR